MKSQLYSHGPAVDIWALGVIIVHLLDSGRRNDFLSLGGVDQESIDIYLDQFFSELPNLSNHIQSFIRKCLVVNPVSRITAKSAVQHPWIIGPPGVTRALDTVDENNALMAWKPRRYLTPMIGELPEVAGSHSELGKNPQVDAIHSRHFRITCGNINSDSISMTADFHEVAKLHTSSFIPENTQSKAPAQQPSTSNNISESAASVAEGDTLSTAASLSRRIKTYSKLDKLTAHSRYVGFDRHLKKATGKPRNHRIFETLQGSKKGFLKDIRLRRGNMATQHLADSARNIDSPKTNVLKLGKSFWPWKPVGK
jgi:serine/threonine protein kinase